MDRARLVPWEDLRGDPMRWLELSLALTLVACGSSQDGSGPPADPETGGGAGTGTVQAGVGGSAGTGVTTGAGGTTTTGGNTGGNTGTAGTSNAGGSRNTGGSAGTGGSTKLDAGSMTDAARLPPDPCIASGTCPLGVWTNVTPAGM